MCPVTAILSGQKNFLLSNTCNLRPSLKESKFHSHKNSLKSWCFIYIILSFSVSESKWDDKEFLKKITTYISCLHSKFSSIMKLHLHYDSAADSASVTCSYIKFNLYLLLDRSVLNTICHYPQSSVLQTLTLQVPLPILHIIYCF